MARRLIHEVVIVLLGLAVVAAGIFYVKANSWLGVRLDADVPLFLTMRDEAKIRPYLEDSEDNRKNLPLLLEKLEKNAQAIAHYQHCAVVGNSYNLYHSGYGSRIDAHDMVLRMNQAPVEGYEKDVGSKTTIILMHGNFSHIRGDSHATVILRPHNSYEVKPYLSNNDYLLTADTLARIGDQVGLPLTTLPLGDHLPNRIKNYQQAWDRLVVLNPAFLRYVGARWYQDISPKGVPSTGFYGIVFALHQCNQVDLFGFGADARGGWSHYWEVGKNASREPHVGPHRADYEAGLLNTLQEKGYVHIYR